MKKNILLIFGIIISLIPFEITAANSASATITCNKKILKADEETTCTIVGNYSGEIAAVEGNIVIGTNLKLISVTKDTIWKGYDNDLGIAYYTDANKTGDFNIAQVRVKAETVAEGADTSVTISGLKFTIGSFDEIDATVQSSSIRIPSTINDLNDIKIDGTTISEFSSSKTSYDIMVDSSKTSVNISFTKNSNKSTTNVQPGVLELDYGIQTYKIDVTSESGAKKTYTLNINRPDTRSKENKISNINIDGQNVSFNLNKQYALNITDDVKNIAICDEDFSDVSIFCLREINNSPLSIVKIYLNNNLIKDITSECDKDGICKFKKNGEDIVFSSSSTNQTQNQYLLLGELLEDNNKLEFVVTAENEESNTYFLNINKSNTSDAYESVDIPDTGRSTSKIFTIFGIILIAGGLVIVIIVKKKKDNNNQ